MLLAHAVRKLVELFHEVSNVDTAHGVDLGEGHGLRESVPVLSVANSPGAYIANDSISPVASQQTPDTWSNSVCELTIMGMCSSSLTICS